MWQFHVLSISVLKMSAQNVSKDDVDIHESFHDIFCCVFCCNIYTQCNIALHSTQFNLAILHNIACNLSTWPDFPLARYWLGLVIVIGSHSYNTQVLRTRSYMLSFCGGKLRLLQWKWCIWWQPFSWMAVHVLQVCLKGEVLSRIPLSRMPICHKLQGIWIGICL